MLETGSIIDGKYKILSKIGQGGMSVVYLAMNEKANKTWAIKEVRKDGVKDFEVVRQGLVVETDLLKKLKHDNLPSIIDVIDDEGRFLIVMDYIEGNPLSQKLEEEGAQPQELVIEWAKQICDVLGYLHTRNPAIIYRDMKPANLMLKTSEDKNNAGKITLIDFGTAREFKERNLADTVCLGTIGYAAPEQFGGRGQTDARTDIYCLGATLYHLVTGKNPSEPPYKMVPIRDINPALSGGLEKIILKCTQQNPDERYQSCAELMYALENYQVIDNIYRNKQKKHLISFCVFVALSLISLCTGVVFGQMKTKEENNNYDKIVDQAQRENNIEKRVELYRQALEIKPDVTDAWIGIAEAYQDDREFTVEEEAQLSQIWETSEDDLKNNIENYCDVCYEIGKLYWYYYSYGKEGDSDNETTKMKNARPYFAEVVKYQDESYQNWGLAKVYESIGDFYKDIANAADEAEDQGMYVQFWEDLKELVGIIEERQDELDIVNFRMYWLVTTSIENYARKFKSDGVGREELEDMLGQIEEKFTEGSEYLKRLGEVDGKLAHIKETIQSRLEPAKEQINIVYGDDRKE